MGLFGEPKLNTELRNTDPHETQKIRSLIERGADPNTKHKQDKPTPLVQATVAGCIPTMKLLIDSGANVNKLDGPLHRQTPLQAAVSTSQYDAIDYLLSRGANIDGVMHIPPLWELLEAKNLNLTMLQFLLDRDANPDAKNIITERPVKHLVRQFCGWHSLQKPPKDSCKQCQRRWDLVLAIVLLRHYGAKLIEKNTGGTSVEEVYSDILAYHAKLEERGERAGKWLYDNTLGDPFVQTLMGWMVMGGLGAIGIPTPASSISGLLGMPEFRDKHGNNVFI
ncbi:ankyrin repeat-containing domain protein [Clohesyomyces aquaticus]|uniref:Ankyrin repeat-containing domain protein n=1 Tax=Clohesyomyces aquaticus TaxID=1231657 RepID=A0A1Y1ZGM8_9PLEO|nr:ankyrin repeat-containing domain protein [Clohesyomyces aquaticus]